MGLIPLVRSIAAAGMPGRLTPPTAPLDPATWRRLLAVVASQRLVAPLHHLVDAGAWPVADEQPADVRRVHESLVSRDLLLERHLLATVDAFEAHGIHPLVLKGVAAAHLVHDDPADRSARDVDLLVRGDDVPRAVELVAARGGQRRYPEPVPGFDRRYSKGAALVLPDGLEIDVHRTLAQGPYGVLVDPTPLFERATTIAVGGRAVGVPCLEDLAAHLCLHAVLGQSPPGPTELRDVALAAHHPDLDVDVLLARVRSW